MKEFWIDSFGITVKSALGNLKSAILLGAMLFALCLPAEAQQPAKIPRIGYLTASSLSAQSARIEAFRQGLRELGYVEGKNIVIELRFGEGKSERAPALAAELVRLKVDIIVSVGQTVTRDAKEATSTIPIVMAQDSDPVRNGFVASLARPGGNITGLATLRPEIRGKQLELLKEIVPNLSRAAVLGSSTEPDNAQSLREVELAAGAFGVKLQYLDVLSSKDIEIAFRAASKGRADAVLVLASSVANSQRTQIAELAVKSRIPAVYYQIEFVEDGGHMAYGPSLYDLHRRAAYVCGQDFEGSKACRSAGRGADKIRIHHQTESSEADRSDDTAQRTGESGQSDSIKGSRE
jgi:putative ABC transport system substrate-binding protein